MKALRIFIIGFAWLTASPALAMSISVLDPYLVRPDHLGNLELRSFLVGNPNLANFEAAALAEDGIASGIVVVQTNSNSPVTISIQNTGSIAPYSDRFLESAPATGTQSLTVSSLWNIGGTYYAVALFQAPAVAPPGQQLAFTTGVTVAQDGNQQSSSNVNLILPPAILVHGLWGDASSLSETEAYLKTSGLWFPQYVTPICYSKYLAFDAKTDPLTDGKDPCEVTSYAALETEINSMLATMDDDHIVAGRVDLVAHSMGGLVLRSYASQKGYTSPRNSMQGQFHAITTLDTPETGSLLANYLIGHRSNKAEAPIYTPPGAVYAALCGNSDVAECFASIGYPLNAPSLSVKTGAVYSLEPGSPSLKNPKLSPPNVTNSQWLAVSALAPGDSALALGINTLIAALYKNPYANNVPTINSLLLNLPNDAIVDINSQTEDAPSGHVITLSKLSHTWLVGSLLTLLSGGTIDDNNVLQNTGVDKIAACWLATAGTGDCSAPREKEEGTPEAVLPNVKAVDGIRIKAPERAELGTPFEIAVHSLIPNSVPELSAFQQSDGGPARVTPVRSTRVDGQTAYVTVTPTTTGLVTFGISASFGSVRALQRVQLHVDLPRRAPLQFKANTSPDLVLILGDETNSAMPRPFAVYPAPVGRIFLNAAYVKCQVRKNSVAPVVYATPDRLLHGLRPGRADVQCSLGSLRDTVHVIVRASGQ